MEESTHAAHFVRLPLRGFGPNPYLFHHDYDSIPPEPEPDTYAPFLVRVPHRALGRNAYLTNPSVEGVEQQDDAGGGSLVVPNWDGYRLARAGRFSYWAPSIASDEPVAEAETLAPHLVRVPFRALGQNPYLRHGAQDLSFVEPLDLPHVLRVVPFKPLGRNPYLTHRAVDDSVEAAAEADIASPHLVRVPFRGLGRTPYLWHGAVEGPEQRNDTGSRVLVVRSWDGLRLTRAGRYAYWGQAKDDFVAPPPETDKPPHFIVHLPFRRYGRNPYLHHRDWQDGPPPPTFVAAWAKNANVLLKAGLVP